MTNEDFFIKKDEKYKCKSSVQMSNLFIYDSLRAVNKGKPLN